MNTPLRVLIVEDSESDSRMILRELQQGGYESQSRRIETAAELTEALADQEWDLVICDFRLPHFSAAAALERVQASGLDLPFILVSGSVGEEEAIAMMKAGAHDFLLKDRLARLAPAVTRELGDADARRKRRVAEEELKQANKKLQGMLDSITDGLAMLDHHWRFTYFSDQAATILGIRPERLIGACVWDLFPQTRDPEYCEEFLRAVDRGQPVHFEKYYAEPLNIWIECHCHPTDEGLSVYFRDITVRRRASELVARQAAELTSLHATAPVGLFFFDTELRYVRVNQEMADLNGLSAEQHVGRTVRELLTPELADLVEPLLRQVLETGRPVLNCELQGASLPRSAEPQRHFLGSYHPVLAEDGTMRGVQGVVMEITKRKEVEDALFASEAAERAQRQELEALMDAIPVAIIISRDASSVRMTANRAAEEMLRLPHGQNPSQSGPDGGRPDFQCWSDGRKLTPAELPMQRATATGQAVSGAEIEIVFPDGERKSLLSSAYPLFDESGALRGCICADVDITVRKRRELNVAFLAETQKSLASISSPIEIMRVTSRRIAEHLYLDHCLFVEINEAADEASVIYDHHAGHEPSLVGVYCLKDFLADDGMKEMATGNMNEIDNRSHDSRSAANSQPPTGLWGGSRANAKYAVGGRWKFILSGIRSKPGEWSAEDTELLDELAERIQLRLARANGEELLTDSEARFRSIFHDASIPMEVSLPNGRFSQVNRAFCELLGYSAEELLEMTFESITFPEDQSGLARQPLRDLMDGTLTSFRAEKRYVRKNGMVVWVDLSVSVVHGTDAKPLYFIGQVQDITGRKQAEASLRKSENMLAFAIEAGQLGIWNWDQSSRTLVWSERCKEMAGLPRDSEVTLEEAMDTVHPEDRIRVQEAARLALEMQMDIELEYRTQWPDASVHWMQTRGRAIFDGAGQVVRITGVIQDVTERRETEDALRRFNTQLESLVDARTEVIKMTMKELQREFAERRRLEEEILDIGERAQARIGQDLHDDLGQQLVGMTILMGLLSSHLGAESHPRAAEAARLQSFLTGIINTTRNLAKSLYPVELERGGLNLSLQELAIRTEMLAGITCRLTADAAFKFDKAVEIHLYRIVQESISNALKHGKARNIAIDCSIWEGVSTLTVTDDGSGFVRPEEGKWAGIGLHLFQYRARLIGAQLTVSRGNNGGCQVKCLIGDTGFAGDHQQLTRSDAS